MRPSGVVPALLVLFLPLAAALAPGCGDDDPEQPPIPTGEQVPDFTLKDVNANSPTFSEEISPRGMQNKISAWYFGSAT
jgi:hypothetical protein